MTRLLGTIVLLLTAATAVHADPPRTLSYQGVLTDGGGTIVPDGTYTISFRLYDAAVAGSLLWIESQNVPVTSGRFDVVLGVSTPLVSLSFEDPYWLALQVDVDPEMTPRTELTASPYSFIARDVEDGRVTPAKIADGTVLRSLNGLTDDVTLLAGPNVTITPTGNSLRIGAMGGGGGGNPPGVASQRGVTGSVTLTGTGTTDVVLSQTITAPAAGYVLAIGSVTLFVNHTNGNPTFAIIGTSDDSASIPSSQDMIVQLPFSAPSGLYTFPVTAHGLYSVPAGDTTFYILGEKGTSGTVTVNDTQLSLVYFETAYGFVQPTIVADSSRLGREGPAGDADVHVVDPVARELADLRARLVKLEALLGSE